MRYYVLCMRISNISLYVRSEMCTNNKFVSTLIWKRLDPIVCQTNMHLIMRIENAFKFCGKLINRISNLQTSSKWEVCLTSTAFNESTDSPTFSNFTIKKNRNPFVVKVNQLTTKFKSEMMRYYVLCMRISNISLYVRSEMCTNNKFVSILTWKRLDRLCQTNMHLE
jgi:hypothetical protein